MWLRELPSVRAGEEARDQVLSIRADPEQVRFDGREVYIYFPKGAGRSKFPWSRIDKIVKQPGTARNWNTVTRLLAMAEELENRKAEGKSVLGRRSP